MLRLLQQQQQQHHRLHQLVEDAASEPQMMSCNASVRPQETDGAQPRHNGLGSAPLSSGDPASADFEGSVRESCRGGLGRAAAVAGGSRRTVEASDGGAARAEFGAALHHRHHLRLHPVKFSTGAEGNQSRSSSSVPRVDMGRPSSPLCARGDSRAPASCQHL